MRYYSKQKGIYQRLPRYYKDKMFTKEQRELMAETAEWEAVTAHRSEVVRLSEFHKDPEAYYHERVRHTHDTMTKTINKNDKF